MRLHPSWEYTEQDRAVGALLHAPTTLAWVCDSDDDAAFGVGLAFHVFFLSLLLLHLHTRLLLCRLLFWFSSHFVCILITGQFHTGPFVLKLG